jgi:hypothetical protein
LVVDGVGARSDGVVAFQGHHTTAEVMWRALRKRLAFVNGVVWAAASIRMNFIR